MSLLKLPPEQLSAWPAGICQLPPESYRLTKLPSKSHCHCLHERWCPPFGQWSPQMGLCPPPHPVYPSSVTLNVSKQQPAPIPQTEDAEKQPSCPLGKTPTGSKLGGGCKYTHQYLLPLTEVQLHSRRLISEPKPCTEVSPTTRYHSTSQTFLVEKESKQI